MADGQHRPPVNAPPQQGPPTYEIVTYPIFGMAVDVPENDGTEAGASRIIRIFTPPGKVQEFLLDPELAKKIGDALAAPSIAVAKASDLPRAADA